MWVSRLHHSTWSYIGWAFLYAGLEVAAPARSSSRRLFAEILGVDFMVNTAMPFLIGGAAGLTTLFAKQQKKVPWPAWVLAGGSASACLIAASLIIFRAGGGLALAGALLFLSRLGWFYRRTGKARDIGMAFARGLFGPWLFMAPALVISAVVVGRQTLGFSNLDWVPLFGLIYFGMQAGFEEFMLRRIEKPGKKRIQPE